MPMGMSPMLSDTARVSPPTVIGGNPRSMAPSPMVAMMTAMIGRPSSGRSTTRSSAKLNATITATAAPTASEHRHLGRQRERGDEARQHHELALREVDGVGGLVDQHEAQRDQRVHEPDRQPADGQREGELQLFPHVGCLPHAAMRLSPRAAGAMSCTASVEVSELLRPSSKVMSMVSRASLAPS